MDARHAFRRVGTFGSAGLRAFEATANAFMRPPAMNGGQAVVSSIMAMWPGGSVSAGPVPLYGTCDAMRWRRLASDRPDAATSRRPPSRS
jgi:hypothetical protein